MNILRCLLLLLLQYCECTDGSHIEVKASALVWHYGDADPDFGNWQVSLTRA
jgi:trehalose 6-phosphate synthase/phosphatase